MSSRKEEERNEKIIRGLMKLPPNRRCINCNHMGPQYVCTNFWTFVCVTCSGIHREFTHRVKSVSMATFASEEVEALQKGGNQRAREIYLKHWDSQSHSLPDNSNADKVREFIRNVYVDKKYLGGGSSDRPPRDLQNGRSRDEEIRRASSYHSYSQSPPNDFQYEERRYGKPVPVLTRKPGSDRGLDGKVSSFMSPGRLSDRSPSQLSDHTNEDSCAAERFGSPLSETSRDFSGEDVVQVTGNPNTDSPARRSFGEMLHPERTASLGSSRSLDSLSLGCASHEHEGPVAVHQDMKSTVPSLSQPSFSDSSDGLDLFNAPFTPATVSSTSATNVTRLPGSSSTRLIDLLEHSPTPNVPTFSSSQQLQPILSPSLDLFPATYPEQSAATSDKPFHFIPQNEGWATFDSPQPVVPLGTANCVGAEKSASVANPVGNFDEHLFFDQWPSVQNNSAHEPLPVIPPFWNASMQNVETLPGTSSSESWSAFEDSSSNLGINQEQVPVHQSSFANHYLSTESETGHSNESGGKSLNPFDLPYDAENMSQYFEMGPLQAALPNVPAPSLFTSGANENWFAQDTIASYVDVGSDGGFGYIAGHAQNAQISTLTSHGSVASVGGNPFA